MHKHIVQWFWWCGPLGTFFFVFLKGASAFLSYLPVLNPRSCLICSWTRPTTCWSKISDGYIGFVNQTPCFFTCCIKSRMMICNMIVLYECLWFINQDAKMLVRYGCWRCNILEIIQTWESKDWWISVFEWRAPCPRVLSNLAFVHSAFWRRIQEWKCHTQLIRQDVTLLLLIMFTNLNFVTNSHFKEPFRVIKKEEEFTSLKRL